MLNHKKEKKKRIFLSFKLLRNDLQSLRDYLRSQWSQLYLFCGFCSVLPFLFYKSGWPDTLKTILNILHSPCLHGLCFQVLLSFAPKYLSNPSVCSNSTVSYHPRESHHSLSVGQPEELPNHPLQIYSCSLPCFSPAIPAQSLLHSSVQMIFSKTISDHVTYPPTYIPHTHLLNSMMASHFG